MFAVERQDACAFEGDRYAHGSLVVETVEAFGVRCFTVSDGVSSAVLPVELVRPLIAALRRVENRAVLAGPVQV